MDSTDDMYIKYEYNYGKDWKFVGIEHGLSQFATISPKKDGTSVYECMP